jgi:hypothetical protein
MDGVLNRTECMAEEADCDLCYSKKISYKNQPAPCAEDDARVQEYRFIAATQTQQTQRVGQQTAEFVRCLGFYQQHCIPCLISYSQDENKSYEAHTFGFGKCQLGDLEREYTWSFINQGVRKVGAMIRKKERFKKFYGCYDCGIPQRYCVRWEALDEDGGSFRKVPGRNCSYDGVLEQVIGTVVGLEWIGDFLEKGVKLARKLGVWVKKDISWEDFTQIGVRWGDLWVNGFCILFWAIGIEYIY